MSANTTFGQPTNIQNNTTISSFPYTSLNYLINFAKHIDIEFEFSGFTGGTTPTIQAVLQAVNPLTSTVLKSYAGVILSAAGHDFITAEASLLGDTVNVTLIATGSPTNITGVYLRLIPK